MSEVMIHLFEQMSLKEAKKTIKEWCDEIRIIENQFLSKLIFEDNYLKVDRLIVKIKRLEKGLKSASSSGEHMKVSRCNNEENSTLAFIYDKHTMLMRVQVFVDLFNELDEDARVIIYHSFFKNCYNVLIAGKLNMSLNKLERIKAEIIVSFAEMLAFEKFLHQIDA